MEEHNNLEELIADSRTSTSGLLAQGLSRFRYLALGAAILLGMAASGCATAKQDNSTPTPVPHLPTLTYTPSPTETPTLEPTLTETPIPTEIPVLFTPDYASNCRFGPSSHLWDVETILNKGQPVPILGMSDSVWGPWLKVGSDKGECWVYSPLGAISGDAENLKTLDPPFPAYTYTPTPYVLRTITVKNNQNVAVCEVDYKRFTVSESFRKLELAEPIQPGKSEKASISKDVYDFRFLDCDGNLLGTAPIVFVDYNTILSTP
jgi:hypothetical protein